ncbi:hypothetical protein HDU79_000386 [Rhizoclosmatium sp. JEL0117]|nr:hypothetical protein HDU79_000386 [Rhizoclosmatium sp. JEL0117]
MLGTQQQPPPPPPPPPPTAAALQSALKTLKPAPQTPKVPPSQTPRDRMFDELKAKVKQRNAVLNLDPIDDSDDSPDSNQEQTHEQTTKTHKPSTFESTPNFKCSSTQPHRSLVSASSYLKQVAPSNSHAARLESLERDLMRVKRKFEQMHPSDSDASDTESDDSNNSQNDRVSPFTDHTSKKRRLNGDLGSKRLMMVRKTSSKPRNTRGKKSTGGWNGLGIVAMAAIGPVVGFAFGFFFGLGGTA